MRAWHTSITLILLMTAALMSLPSIAVSQPQTTQNGAVAVTVDYPSQVKAGENFALTASLVNTSSEPMLVSVNWALRLNAVSGGHASSYRIFSHPVAEATPFTRIVLEPGVPRVISLREFYYEHDELFGGELIVKKSDIWVSDTDWERTSSLLDPIVIEVIHEGPTSVAAVQYAPGRLPLERRVFGDDNEDSWVVYDPNTGQEWLPLSRTHDRPLLSVMEDLLPGSEFEGFRIANFAEVQTLLLNAIHAAGVHYPQYALFAVNEYEDVDAAELEKLYPIARRLLDKFGITRSVRRQDHESATAAGILVGTNEVPDAVLEATISTMGQLDHGRFFMGVASEMQVSFLNSGAGVWLLRESEK